MTYDQVTVAGQKQAAELYRLRRRVKTQRAELRRLNKTLGPYWAGFRRGLGVSESSNEIQRLRAALLICARQAEELKRPCGLEPESAQALRNAEYQSISTNAHIALGTMRGPVLK